jgi:hypothetical protein
MTRLSVVLSLGLAFPVFAQEPTSSTGKLALTVVTKGLEKLATLDPVKSANAYQSELDKVRRKLEALKAAEPGFDVSAHEKRLAGYEQVLAQGKADKAAAKDARAREVADKKEQADAEAAARLAEREAKAAEQVERHQAARDAVVAEKAEKGQAMREAAAADKAAAEQREAEALARVRLKPALRSDAALEALFKKALEAEGWGEQILAVNLLDTDWHITKHPVTGAVLHRYQTAAMKTKNKAGKCLAYEFTMQQDFDGTKFQAVGRRSGHNATFMLCDK